MNSYRSSARDMRLCLAGDVMLSRALRAHDEPPYLSLLELLRGADLSFANLESVVREPHEGWPALTLGTPMTTPPALLEDLKWIGLKLVSIANNHASDWGTSGLEAMVTHLRRAGLQAAGAGSHLAAARAPAYVETARGRVALVAATSFFKPWNAASDQRPDTQGRPGINPLGFATTYEVDGPTFEALLKASRELGLAQERERHSRQFFSASELGTQDAQQLTLFGQHFRRTEGFAVRTVPQRADAEANLRAIREARRQADWVIFSFHSHEFGDGARLTARSDTELLDPGAFAVQFARAAVEAGADVVAGHGHHVTLGMELHAGRPIFYSLGNFVFQNDTVQQVPTESYRRFGLGHEATPADFMDARNDQDRRGFPAEAAFWEGCLAEVDFAGGGLRRVRLHPLDLGFGTRRSERGRPVLAQGTRADPILERLATLSRRHSTRCTRVGDALDVELV
ncbi:MAG: hypothetical protein RI988_2687 [Pseudomonadota bacterium]|jgi:poly-gamma-glutamate synthesis protein (capsule biosynthesis protein)